MKIKFCHFIFPILLLPLMIFIGCEKHEKLSTPSEQNQNSKIDPLAVDLTKICNNLSKEMQLVDNTRTTFALEQINQNLKSCLPIITFDKQLKFIDLSTQMYNNFLKVERDEKQQIAFDLYALNIDHHPTIQSIRNQEFSLRDQYLLKHKGQAYIELYDTDDNKFIFRRNPQYLSRVFSPYLPEAESVFIENLAEQNQQAVLTNNKIMIPVSEISKRAVFWENYLKKYPKSHFSKDAQYLAKFYSQLLFKGTDKSPVSDTFDSESSINYEHLIEIEKLSRADNSKLSDQAKKFLNFIHTKENEKNNSYNNTLTPKESSQQLSKYLNLKAPNQHYGKDCFSDAICI